jgi:hypothetical protein
MQCFLFRFVQIICTHGVCICTCVCVCACVCCLQLTSFVEFYVFLSELVNRMNTNTLSPALQCFRFISVAFLFEMFYYVFILR